MEKVLITGIAGFVGSHVDESRYTSTWGDIGTSSFYPPHHITMGEGGCVYTYDPLRHC